MRVVRFWWVCVGLCFAVGQAYAQAEQCYEYRREPSAQMPSPSWSMSPGGACAAAVPADEVQICAYGTTGKWEYSYQGFAQTDAGPPAAGMCEYLRTNNVEGCVNSAGQPMQPAPDAVLQFVLEARPTECPEEGCDGSITGEKFQKTGALGTLAASYCHAGSRCVVEGTGVQVCLGGTCFASYTGTEEACTDQSDEGGLRDTGEDCVLEGGLEVCKNPDQGEDCGYYNDEYVCLKKTADRNRCFEHTDGSMICAEGTPLPPAPDSGTPGEGADPDAQVTINQGDTSTEYHYYGPGTVAGSSRPPGGEAGIDPEDTGSGTCTGDDCGEGSGEASGGETCAAPPSCSGDPIQCAVLNQQWRNRCVGDVSDSELEAMFGPTSNEDGSLVGPATEFSVPGALESSGWIAADCPADLTVVLGGMLPTVTIPISEWCGWMSIIGMMVMVSAYIGGIRIIIGGL